MGDTGGLIHSQMLHRRVVPTAAAAAVLASATEAEDGSGLLWRPDDEFASQVILEVINSRSALSPPGNDSQRFAHLQPIIYSDIE